MQTLFPMLLSLWLAIWQPVADTWTALPSWLKFLILAHAVNTWPTPGNKWGQWFLGIVKFGVGQRMSAINSINGLQTEVTAVTTAQKTALQNGSEMVVRKSNGPTSILVPTEITPSQKP